MSDKYYPHEADRRELERRIEARWANDPERKWQPGEIGLYLPELFGPEGNFGTPDEAWEWLASEYDLPELLVVRPKPF